MDQGYGQLDRVSIVAPCCLRPTPHNIKIAYRITNDGKQILNNLNEQFISEVNDAIREGKSLPKCKKADIIQPVTVAAHTLNHTCNNHLAAQVPTLPPHEVPTDAFR